MSKISKRLLSWLCVIAMVLSFVPVMNLSVSAAETEAAEEIVYGSANYEGVDAEVISEMVAGNAIDNSDEAFAKHLANNTCPVCGNIEGWEKLSNATDKEYVASHYYGKEEHAGLKLHFYYDDAVTQAAGNMIGFAEKAYGNTACIWIKSTQNITNISTRAVMLSNDNVVNFFGEGSITTDLADGATHYNMFQIANGVLNLYGGNFVFEHPQADFRQAAIRVDGANAVVNIFDAATIGPAELDTTKVTQNVQFTKAGTVNMFGGTIRNGVSPAWGYAGNVNVAVGGTFNMYAGTITGGTYLTAVTSNVTMAATIGGNVIVGGKNQEAFYDKTETVDETTGEVTATTYKENYTIPAGGGTFNMYGGTITDGKANNGGNGGGNIYVAHGSAVLNMQGGTVSDGYAKAIAGNLQLGAGVANISGTALITGGEAKTNGGNIYVRNTGSTLNVSGGKIADGTAPNGGNIYIDNGKNNTISGGIISGGLATTNGGNLYMSSNAAGKVAITGGTFLDGISNGQGGNIYTAIDLEMSNATVMNGIGRTGGGNIKTSTGKDLTLIDCTFANGWVSGEIDAEGNLSAPGGGNWGGNISVWCGDVVIDGGLYYGGVRGVDKKNSRQDNNIAVLASVESSGTANVAGASLTIKGDAIIVGDVGVSAPSANSTGEFTCPGTTVTLAGAPTLVNKYTLADGTAVAATYGGLTLPISAKGSVKADISGLTTDAYVMFTTPSYSNQTAAASGRVVTQAYENAAALLEAGCFGQTNSAWTYAVNENNEVYVITVPEEEAVKPEATLGGQNITDDVWAKMKAASEIQKADLAAHIEAGTCPACGATGITWKEATKPGQFYDANFVGHYYIDNDTAITYNYNWCTLYGENQQLCFALLNDTTPKTISGLIATRGASKNAVINVFGEGTIINGTQMGDQLGLFRTQGTTPIMNIYGGTFYREYVEGDAAKPKGALLSIDTGTVNIYDDVTIGRAEQADTTHYNVFVKNGTLNMYGGTIRNGRSGYGSGSNLANNYSGNVTLMNSTSVFNMYGGTIKNGSYTAATTSFYGGNIAGQVSNAKVYIYGGTIIDGEASGSGGNIYLYQSTLEISGGTISGGEAQKGGNISASNCTITVSEYAKIHGGIATGSDGGGNIHMYNGGTLNMTGGVIYGGQATTSNGGNILATGRSADDTETQTTNFTAEAVINMSGNAKIYDGTSANQAGNIRIYIGTLTMTDNATVYGGTATGASTDNVWLVDGHLEMSGNATVLGTPGTSGSAVSVIPYKRDLTATLKGNASVGVAEGDSANVLYVANSKHYTYKTAIYGKLIVDDSWAGTAYWTNGTTYAPGAAIPAVNASGTNYTGKLYNGADSISALAVDDGTLKLAAAATVDSEGNVSWVGSNKDALENYDPAVDAYVILTGEAEVNEPILLDASKGAVTLSGTGEVTLIDTANKDFETTHKVTATGEVTVKTGETIVDGDRYITLQDGNVYTAHYVEMKLTAVTLRTGDAPGLYYKASYKCDAALRDRVLGYGAVISAANMPGADFMEDEDSLYTTYSDADFQSVYGAKEEYVVATTSGSVFGVLKEVGTDGRTAAENVAAANNNLYANLYLAIDLDGTKNPNSALYIMGDYDNAGKSVADAGFAGTAFSLNSVMAKIDAAYESYSEAQKTIINNFMETWGMFLTGNFKNL